MSHGNENGVIHTDFLRSGTQPKAKSVVHDFNDFEEYTIDDIFKAVNSNPNLINSLIIIVIQVYYHKLIKYELIFNQIYIVISKACRGTLTEAIFENGDTRNRDTPETSKYSCRVPVFEMPNNSIVLFATVEG